MLRLVKNDSVLLCFVITIFVTWLSSSVCFADFPIIEASATYETNSTITSHAVNLPTSIVEDDLLIMIFRAGSTETATTPTGWTLLSSRSNNGVTYVWYRRADGTEGATVTVTTAGNIRAAAITYRISNSSGLPVAIFTASNTNDPPSVTPSWGSAETLWLAGMTNRRSDSTTTAAPINFQDLQTIAQTSDTGTTRSRVSSAIRYNVATTQDPGAFTTSGTIDNPHSVTIAVKPRVAVYDGNSPVVEDTSTYQTDSTISSHAVDLPLGIQTDDLLIIIFRPGSTQTASTPAGWTLLGSRSSTGNTYVWYRRADGTEGTTVTVTTGGNIRAAAIAYRISNWSGTPEISFTGSNTNDPPSLTASWGSSENLWIALLTNRRSDSSVTAFPTFFLYLQSISQPSNTGTTHSRVSSAIRFNTTATENPAAFTTTGTIDNPHSATIVIAPRVPAPTLLSNDGGENQIAFDNIKHNSTEPIFRVSATHHVSYNRLQVELNTASDFSGTDYTQTFTGTYNSATEDNLSTTGLSPSLPTTDGATYYVRIRASDDAGSLWGNWSTTNVCCNPWTYTYKSAVDELADWFQTSEEQFSKGTLSLTGDSTDGSVQLAELITATGGSTIDYGGYRIHTFTTSGTFQVTAGSGNVEILVVGGGGGGGGRHGGGGGAGGLVYGYYPVTIGSYAVTIGAGGAVCAAGPTQCNGKDGGSSVFGSIIALGGAGGGSYTALGSRLGGSGGGGGGVGPTTAGTCDGCAENRNGGPASQLDSDGVPGYGSDGGNGAGPGATASMTAGGGGGGAGAAGSLGVGNLGGAGGNGMQISITGTATYYAGGGGGGSGGAVANVAAGGLGGGGNGGSLGGPGSAGTANTGGGGGGSRSDAPGGSTSSQGGLGGSGVVIVRYPTTISAATLMSPPISLSSGAFGKSWDDFNWTEDETDGNLYVQVYFTDVTTCDTLIPDVDLAGNSTGFATGPVDLDALDVTTYSEICLQATLEDSGGTPHLRDWMVRWIGNSKIIFVE